MRKVAKPDRIQIAYDLEFLTPFHSGTGTREGLIDRKVTRDRDGYLYIPGSTIKGVVRERCEQLARMYEDSDDIMRELTTTPHATQRDEGIALRGLGMKRTMITRIFGSQIHPGQLFFDDARQSDEDKQQYDSSDPKEGKRRYENLQVDVYTQVRLDRLTRTAVPGALYTSEFGVRNMVFKGAVVGSLACTRISDDISEAFSGMEHGPTYSLLLLLAGLLMIERLGGNKSTGKGQCRCKIKELKINDTPIQDWTEWLQHLEVLSYYSLVQEDM
jgi:CRISPR/Cas system CMR subunit Cmr4 (Cas7 group RAMP superfamily)